MTGTWCDGVATNNFKTIIQFKAYAEGFEYRQGGDSTARPSSDNPHPAGTPANAAWAAGWSDALNNTGEFCVGGPERTSPSDP